MITDPAFRNAWRSGRHVGGAKPRTIVKIQRGLLDRAYQPFDGEDNDFGRIGGSDHNDAPWHAFWRPTGGWIDLPNLVSVETSTEFQPSSGMADPETATIVVDNVVYEQAAGVAGIYHRIRRGWLAPLRGWTNYGARNPNPDAAQNEWFDVLSGGYRVRIWQGYGDALVPVFTGLIDDNDVTDTPDQITLSCRSFGQVLTESRIFGSNKAKEIGSPIVFHDRLKADLIEPVGGGAKASSETSEHRAVNVTKKGSDTFWFSQRHTDPAVTEWVQVRLPAGRYNEFYVAPGYDDMEMFLSFYVRPVSKTKKATVDGAEVNDGWIFRGLGDVPGANGGFPYVYHWKAVSAGGMKRKLPFELLCGSDTVMRVSFRKLGKHADDDYRARCSRLAAYKAKRKESASKKHWVMVEDASDCIKWALMWAGFKKWNVEKIGVRLSKPVTFDQSQFLSDIIKHFVDETDYTFFIDRFDDTDEGDIGIPNFVRTRALIAPPPYMEEVRDTDLLEDIDTKFTKEPLSYIIRVRGKVAEKKEGEVGVTLGADKVKRIQATYFPPWSGAHHDPVTGQYTANYPFAGRLSGLIKHVVYYDNMVENPDEAMVKAILIAIQQALASLNASIQIPGHPGMALNEQISIVDTPTGVNTRMWINSRSTTWTGGAQGEFKTTLGGAMVDHPDLLLVALDYLYFLSKVKEEAEA